MCLVPKETTLGYPELGLYDILASKSIKGIPDEMLWPANFANTIFLQSSNWEGGLLAPFKGLGVFTPFWGLGVAVMDLKGVGGLICPFSRLRGC